MTATSTSAIPLFEYSLARGIDDGFLAPYRVRRVVLSPDAHGWEPTPEQLDRFGKEIPHGLYTTKEFERVVSLLTRTEEAARHLTEYLCSTDRWAKTIVFCVDQEHADQMRRALHNANADLTRAAPELCRSDRERRAQDRQGPPERLRRHRDRTFR